MTRQDTPIHPDGQQATTAPEVPHAVARRYGVHTEALHASSPPEQPRLADTVAETADDPTLANPETDAAVDDIVSKESDQLLGIQDTPNTAYTPARRTLRAKIKHFFVSWWRHKPARYITIAVLVIGLATLSVVPTTRYALLNFAGVRSSASLIVLDDTTQLPLKNVTVRLNGVTAQTNREGVAKLRDLRLGTYRLTVARTAFAPYKQTLTIGWGSNPLGHVKLRAVGNQYHILVKDYLSGKPLAGAEAESDAVNALSDTDGKITLTVEDTELTTLAAKINLPGYRSESITLDATNPTAQTVVLVPSAKTVFVSKASGTFDVYASYIDGQDRKVLLAGTGRENNNISVVVSPDQTQAAVVSTRDDTRDEDGYLLYALTFINLEQGTAVTVDHAQQLQLVDWVGNRLLYRATIAGASAANPQRNRLIAYNYATNARSQLATANQFNTVISAEGYLYYAASGTDPGATMGLFRVKSDSSGRERLTDQEVWTGLRTDSTTLSLQTPDGWLRYNLRDKKVQKSSAPPVFVSIFFAHDPKNERMAWTDTRDNKGVLLLKELSNETTKTLATQPGLTYPLRWLNDTTIIYRVVTAGESADYAVSINGGSPRKVTDVTATYGYIQAY